jgi:hypothetical protein
MCQLLQLQPDQEDPEEEGLEEEVHQEEEPLEEEGVEEVDQQELLRQPKPLDAQIRNALKEMWIPSMATEASP